MTPLAAPLFIAALLGASSVLAQPGEVTVWRCGADGRSFSDSPCPGGQARLLTIDRPDAERQQQALAVAEREAQTAKMLQRERRAREREARSRQTAPVALTVRAGPRATVTPGAGPRQELAKGGRQRLQASGDGATPRREALAPWPAGLRPADARTSAAAPRAIRRTPD